MTKLAHLGVAATIVFAAAVGIGRAGDQDEPAEPPIAAQPAVVTSTEAEPEPEPEEYVVEPPDVLLVEVLEALEGRPISGERSVRPDGKISLGFYGEVYVAGLTIPEMKEKVVHHLRTHLDDERLGLVAEDPKTGKPVAVALKDTDRVFIDVTAYNSKKFYALGMFKEPGKYPATGIERVLDAVMAAGGLADDADATRLTVIRDGPDEGPARKRHWTVDLNRIISGADPSMNHRLRPGDRLIAAPKRRDENAPEPQSRPTDPPEPTPADLARRLDRIEALLEKLTRGPGE